MGLFDSISDFFGGGEAANRYLDKAMDASKGYLEPYMKQGQDAYGQLNPQYSAMSNDPTGYLNKILGQYQTSPAYKLKMDEMGRAAGNTAAAGGMRGSLGDITNQAKLSDRLMGEDMQQWLQNVMGIQGGGMNGLQNFYNQGAQAAGGLAGDVSNIYGSKAQAAQSNQNGWMSLLGGLGGAALTAGLGGFGNSKGPGGINPMQMPSQMPSGRYNLNLFGGRD